jgi:DNA-binding response OmpR family regulator
MSATICRLLVVEDEPAVRGLLRIMFERRGFAVETVVDGLDAMELLRRQSFTLILMDLMLPRASGYDVLEFVARERIATPIILLTAAGDSFVESAANPESVLAIFRKPFDVDFLTAAVSAVADEILAGSLDPKERLRSLIAIDQEH